MKEHVIKFVDSYGLEIECAKGMLIGVGGSLAVWLTLELGVPIVKARFRKRKYLRDLKRLEYKR